jgi:hypothetical protein
LAQELAQDFVLNRRGGLAPYAVPELRLDHAETTLGIGMRVVMGHVLVTVQGGKQKELTPKDRSDRLSRPAVYVVRWPGVMIPATTRSVGAWLQQRSGGSAFALFEAVALTLDVLDVVHLVEHSPDHIGRA